MNALGIALTKIDTEVERIVQKLDDVAYGQNKRGDYRHEAYTRQGAVALMRQLTQIGPLANEMNDGDGSWVVFGAKTLDTIADRWNDREDWRTAAFAANVHRAIERLVGLS